MTFDPYHFRAIVRPLWECHLNGQLVGQILEQDGLYQARSWPELTLIGTYPSRDQAVDAINAVARHNNFADELKPGNKPMVRQWTPTDLDELFAKLSKIIQHHRSIEIFALFRYLHDRGFHSDDLLPIAVDALARYADEQT